MNDNVLEVIGLRGGYDEVEILRGIDFTLGASEILMVAGPNGCGKSTMTKAIIGLLPRVKGEIRFLGNSVLGKKPEDRVRLGISYVPQVANVFPSLSVLENLQVVEIDKNRERVPIDTIFELFPALAERRRNRAGSLSGGERQQLAFARGLMSRPQLMILDEPTANVSPNLVEEILGHVKRMPELGTAVLLIEQRAREGLSIADRGILLNQGEVVTVGAAAELLADETLAEQFLGHDHH